MIRKFPDEMSFEIEQRYQLPLGTINKNAFFNDDLDEAIKGIISDREWRSNIALRIQKAFPLCNSDAAVKEWSAFTGIINFDVLNAYKDAVNDRPFILMTNATDKLDNDLLDLKIRKEFDFILNSSTLGFAKPDREIFDFVLDKLKLKSNEVAFIDDSENIILKAKELGFICHHFIDDAGFFDFCNSTLS